MLAHIFLCIKAISQARGKYSENSTKKVKAWLPFTDFFLWNFSIIKFIKLLYKN